MNWFRPRYNIKKEIDQINIELGKIFSIKETIKTRGWEEIAQIFGAVIARFTQDVLEKCDDPKKNEIEIICKKAVAESLGTILSTIDSRVRQEGFLQRQVADKTAKAEEIARQKQQI